MFLRVGSRCPLVMRMDQEPALSPPSEIAARASKGPDAPAVAKLLVEIGQRLVLAGENPYKARSYTRAAESLLLLSEPLEEVIAAGRLSSALQFPETPCKRTGSAEG